MALPILCYTHVHIIRRWVCQAFFKYIFLKKILSKKFFFKKIFLKKIFKKNSINHSYLLGLLQACGLLLGEWLDRLLRLAFGVTPAVALKYSMGPDGGPEETSW